MKVEKKTARQAFPPDIQPGDIYFRWKFRQGGWQRSKTYPSRQQLTRSDFLIQAYDLDDRYQALTPIWSLDDVDSVLSEIEEIVEEIRNLGEEAQGRLDNMPEALQTSSPSGELLSERIEGCEEWATEMEGIIDEINAAVERWEDAQPDPVDSEAPPAGDEELEPEEDGEEDDDEDEDDVSPTAEEERAALLEELDGLISGVTCPF